MKTNKQRKRIWKWNESKQPAETKVKEYAETTTSLVVLNKPWHTPIEWQNQNPCSKPISHVKLLMCKTHSKLYTVQVLISNRFG